MQGWKLFKHALRMLFGNWREVLRIFLVPSLLGLAILGVFTAFATTGAGDVPEPTASFFVSFLGIFLLVAVLGTWCIVAWHRFILLEETPTGWIPPFDLKRILAYWWQVLKLGLAFLAIAVPLSFIVSALLQASLPLALIIGVPAYFMVAAFYLRLAPTLPASAIGRPISFSEALEATKGRFGELFVLILALAGLQVALQLLVMASAFIAPMISIPVSFAVSLLSSLLNISILTTLHGHYIEGRSLD